jgi:CheY-like chemotaxis protein
LGNACKFSRQGGVVEFHVSLHQATEEQLHTFVEAKFDRLRDVEAVEEPDDPPVVFPPWKQILRFVVKDYGKGISRTDFSKIFQPFLQANMETERVYGGTGLGLAITLRLVRLLGGTIEVDSEEGKWSKFTVDLPFIDGIADVQRISEPLSGDYVFLIGAPDYKVRHLRRVFETFKIKHVVLDEHKVVDISTEEPMDCKRSIFLVQEDIVDQIQLPLSSSRSKLFTFGAKYRIKEGAGHYRSLTQMIPSNLLVSLCKEQETTRDYPETTSDDLEMKTDRPLRILIAEDNVVNQKVLLRMLHRMNLDDVHVVDDGKKAVDREAAEPFDVVLMDMQMPVMDGIEACRRIVQRVGAHKNAKIVFITAHVSPSFEDQCARVGAISFVPKPFKIDDIERCVQKIRTIIQAEEGGHRYLNSKEKHV